MSTIRADLAAIRQLLEQLVELEQQRPTKATRADRARPSPRPEDYADAARASRRYARAPWRKKPGA